MRIETVKIQDSDGFLTINKADFDFQKHTLYAPEKKVIPVGAGFVQINKEEFADSKPDPLIEAMKAEIETGEKPKAKRRFREQVAESVG